MTIKKGEVIAAKNKPTHTPGPWEESQMTMGFIVGGDGNYVARTDFPHRTSSGDNTFNANARLIAAAPDLLEAAQDLMTELRKHYSGHTQTAAKGCRCAQCKMVAAIAKAEGK